MFMWPLNGIIGSHDSNGVCVCSAFTTCLRLVVNVAFSAVLIAWLSHEPLGLGGCNLSFFFLESHPL